MKPYHDPAEQIETEDISPKESYKGPITRSRIKTLEQNDSGRCLLFRGEQCRTHNLLQVPIAELAERWTELPQVSGLPKNEVVGDLAKASANDSMDLEDHMVLTSTEIYSRAKELIHKTWFVLPVHPCTFFNVWGFPVRRLLLPPAVLRLCADLWDHGSSIVKLDQMEISPTTTTLVFVT
ncbi:uncharacterized protein TNCV_3760371 [Trichonephila clavipes]|nr:uncharacterized protein TNCV_3760371 [Trichonephila clavipes]